MALVNSKQLFKNALKGNYAIGAFNFVNYEVLVSIINMAKKHNSPVIIQSSMGAVKYTSFSHLKAMVYALCEPLDIDVCWNLDHGKTFEECKLAIDNGFTNVMIDASDKPFDENVVITKQVVEYAHARGVTVEAELGTLKGIEDDINVSEEDAFYTVPEQAKKFVELTNCDSLAIAIGTAHGPFKYKGEGHLEFDILKELEELLPNYPFVLHGASAVPPKLVEKANKFGAKIDGASGVPEHHLVKACTQHNICKVNMDTDLRISFLAGLREHLTNHPENIDLRSYLNNAKQEVEKTVEHKILNILHSNNKNN